MRRNLFVLLAVILSTVFSGCMEKMAVMPESPAFTASIDENGDTRTYVDGYSVRWSADDRISILAQGAGNKEYRFCGEAGASYGSFEPTGQDINSDGPFYAVYPYRGTTSLSNGVIRISLPSKQTYAAGTIGPGAGVMAALSDDRDLHFKNVCGILVLRFYGEGSVKSVSISDNDAKAITGTAEIKLTNGIPSVNLLTSSSNSSITIQPSKPVTLGASAQDATEFWFALPPMCLEKGFSAKVTDNKGRSTTVATAKAVDIVRNRIIRMAPLKLDFTVPTEAEVGSPLPQWQVGYLDIHSINGGRGEAFYYILPDGTTMLCDAAGAPPGELWDYGEGKSQGVPSKPDIATSSGAVITAYIRHFTPPVAGGRLDYFLTSHYHGDHIGSWRNNYSDFGWMAFDKNGNKVSTVDLDNGGFVRNGISEVGMSIPIGKVIDRGDWASRPSTDYYSTNGKKFYSTYVNFLDYSARTYGTVRESFKIGHTDQLVLLHQPAAYANFSIRTIASGGNIWTGSGTSVNSSYMPSAAECDANHKAWDINENIFSNVIHLKYGNFDWFSGGDIQYNDRSNYSWKDIEKPISKVMKKVEVMKASHHSTTNTNSADLLGVLKPDVYIAGVWRDVQPNPATLKRVYTANSSVKIFTTNLADTHIATLKSNGVNPDNFCATGGHVVVRVLPGGGSYYVFVLDDSDMSYTVKAVFGPYSCE